MEKETLYCVKPHTYDAVYRQVGEPMQVRKKHSAVLIALGRASRTPPENVVIPFRSPSASGILAQNLIPPADVGAQAQPDASDDKSPTEDADAVKRALRAEYKALAGKDAHGRTSIETLRAEIERMKAE